MENKKTNNKEVLSETQIITEFIGTLVNAIFKGKAKNLGKKFYGDPRLKKALETYVDDTNKLRKELKSLGYANPEDLKQALKNQGGSEYIEF
jgi:hypothetical protein